MYVILIYTERTSWKKNRTLKNNYVPNACFNLDTSRRFHISEVRKPNIKIYLFHNFSGKKVSSRKNIILKKEKAELMSPAMLPPDRIGFSRQLHFFPKTKMSLKSVFAHVASIYANLLEQKRKRLHKKGLQLPQDWFRTPTWPPFKLFWDCNMAAVTSCENTL